MVEDVVDKLKTCIDLNQRISSNWEWEDTYNRACADLIRDHGQALVEAVSLSDAAKWLTDNVGCNLISDDDGRWAVSTSGFQPVPEDGGFTETVSITSFVDPEEWKPSILEAIDLARTKASAGGGA